MIEKVKKVDVDSGGITFQVNGLYEEKEFSAEVWLEYNGRDGEVYSEDGNVPPYHELFDVVCSNEKVMELYTQHMP